MRRLLLVTLAVGALSAAPALGGTIQVGLGLHGGSLGLQAPSAAALAGRTVQVAVTVADARGNGAGWTLELNAGSNVLVTGITARCASNSTCTLPRASAGGGILHAASGTGMGVIDLVVSVSAPRSGSASVPLAFHVS
jgi:hypothetical protein